MFHPLWQDIGGQLSAAEEKSHCKLCGPVCPECGHPMSLHRANGSCNGSSACRCGGHEPQEAKQKQQPQPKRRKNRGTKVGVTTRADVMKHPCHYCGENPQSIDHLLPWSQGGTNRRDNLVAACWICNGMKADGTQEDLIAFCMDLATATTHKKSKRHLIWFATIKAHAPKILAWHMQKAQQLPVV